MNRICFIDIAGEPGLYIIERRADELRLEDTKRFSCTKDYEIAFPESLPNIDEFYLSLPMAALNFRLMELPFSDKEKILSVLPFELDNLILNKAGDVIIDAIILESSGGKSKVLAVYAEKTVLKNIIERFGAFNIEPRVITSIELNRIAKKFNPQKLLDQIDMSREERAFAAMDEINNSSINLRKEELSYTKDTEKTKKSLRWTFILGIIAVLLLASSMLLKMISTRKEISAAEEDMKKIYSEIFPSAPGDKNTTAGLYQFKSRIKEIKDKESLLIGVSPLNVLLNLSNVNKGGISFNEITMDREKITLKGEAASFSDIQQAKDALNSFLEEVNISDSKTSSQGRIFFTITAQEKKA